MVAGVGVSAVTGTRALDETKVGAAAGAIGGALNLATGTYTSLSAWEIWVWGIALPATAGGLASHYYTSVRNKWNAYWQHAEQSRWHFHPMLG